MTFVRLLGGLAATSVFLSQPALAFPGDAAELREIIATEFGGDANAYVQEEAGDFRRMACRNRADLVQQLLDDGLVVANIPFRTLERFYECAIYENEWDALALIINPETLAVIEEEASSVSLPLQDPVYGNNYKATRLLLENGAHTIDNRRWTEGVLTKDGHRLNIAGFAVRENLNEVLRAFEDAGYGEIVADARQPGFWDLVYNVGTGEEIGGGFGGLLGGIASVAGSAALGGVALGGSATDLLLSEAAGNFLGATMGDGEEGEQVALSPQSVEMQRRLSRYLLTVDAPPEPEPEPVALAAQPAAAPAPASATLSTLEELERLADLRDRGVLSEAEFEMMKEQILPPAGGTSVPAATPSTPPAETSRSPVGSESTEFSAAGSASVPSGTPSAGSAASPVTPPDMASLGGTIEFDDIEATDLEGMLANAFAVAETGDTSIFYDEQGRFRTTQAPEVGNIAAVEEEETYPSGQPVGDRNRFMFLATRKSHLLITTGPNHGCSIPWDWGEWSSTPPAEGWGTIECEEVDTVDLYRVDSADDPCIYGGSAIIFGPTTAARIFRIEPLTRAEVEVGVAYEEEEFHIFRRAQQDAKSTIEIRFVDRGPVDGARFFRYRDAAERFVEQAGCTDIQYRTES